MHTKLKIRGPSGDDVFRNMAGYSLKYNFFHETDEDIESPWEVRPSTVCIRIRTKGVVCEAERVCVA